MMLCWLDHDDEHEWVEVVNVDGGTGWGDGHRGAVGNGSGGWETRTTPPPDLYQAAWESPTGISQLYLLSAMVNMESMGSDESR